MNNNSHLDKLYEKAILAFQDKSVSIYKKGIWKICHELAEARHILAKSLFIEGLDDPRWSWRRESVRLLGLHYKEIDDFCLEKIRHLGLKDNDSGVRIAAMYVLGKLSKFEDKTFVQALIYEQNIFVKKAAFYSLLELSPLSSDKKAFEKRRIRTEELRPTIDNLKSILSESNLFALINKLEEKENR